MGKLRSCSYFAFPVVGRIPLAIATDSSPEGPVANLHIMYANAYPAKLRESLPAKKLLLRLLERQRMQSLPKAPRGRLSRKFADLAVLSQDIFQVALEDLPKTGSVLTIVNGTSRFRHWCIH
jgi:predicted amidohydrolase YtcJ